MKSAQMTITLEYLEHRCLTADGTQWFQGIDGIGTNFRPPPFRRTSFLSRCAY